LTHFAYGNTGRRVIPVKENEGGLRFVKGMKPGIDICRLAGVEIELSSFVYSTAWESFVRTISLMGCDVVRDGSLPDTGIEIVTAPWSGKVFKEKLDYILSALDKHSPRVNNQCGLHVHIDARDFTVYDIRRMLMLWDRVETWVAAMVPEERLQGSMCKLMHLKPIVELLYANRSPMLTKHLLYGMLYGEVAGAKKHKTSKYGEMRYYGLNLHSWNIRKTLEFRFPPGTKDYETICFWAALFSQIVELAYRSKEIELQKIPKDVDKYMKEVLDSETYHFAEGRFSQ
jgi:hypothetical protein